MNREGVHIRDIVSGKSHLFASTSKSVSLLLASSRCNSFLAAPMENARAPPHTHSDGKRRDDTGN